MNLLALVSTVTEEGERTPIALASSGIYVYRCNSGKTYLCNILYTFMQNVFSCYTNLRGIVRWLQGVFNKTVNTFL